MLVCVDQRNNLLTRVQCVGKGIAHCVNWSFSTRAALHSIKQSMQKSHAPKYLLLTAGHRGQQFPAFPEGPSHMGRTPGIA